MVVPPGRIKHTALLMRADPRPGFARLPFGLLTARTVLQHGAVLVVMPLMDVGFIPTGEAAIAGENRMVGFRDLRAEHARPMRLELSADQRHIAGGIAETGGCTVQSDESVSGCNVLQQGGLLVRRDFGVVGVQDESVEVPESGRRQRGEVVRVLNVDAVTLKDRDQLRRPVGRTVQLVVAEKQQREPVRIRIGGRRCECEQSERCEKRTSECLSHWKFLLYP